MTVPNFVWWCEVDQVARAYNFETKEGDCCKELGHRYPDCKLVEILDMPFVEEHTQILVKGFDLTHSFLRNRTRRDMADALEAAGVTPAFWKASLEDPDTRATAFALTPRSQWRFLLVEGWDRNIEWCQESYPGGMTVTGPEPCRYCKAYVNEAERYYEDLKFADPPRKAVAHRVCAGV